MKRLIKLLSVSLCLLGISGCKEARYKHSDESINAQIQSLLFKIAPSSLDYNGVHYLSLINENPFSKYCGTNEPDELVLVIVKSTDRELYEKEYDVPLIENNSIYLLDDEHPKIEVYTDKRFDPSLVLTTKKDDDFSDIFYSAEFESLYLK